MAYLCCGELTGIGFDCNDIGVAGIEKVWFACKSELTNINLFNDQIDAITPLDSFHLYQFADDQSSFTVTYSLEDNGSASYEVSLNLLFNVLDTPKRVELEALALTGLVAIVKDNNGRYWFFGIDKPLRKSEATAETGVTTGDFNGFNVTFTTTSQYYFIEVASSVMAELDPDAGIITNNPPTEG